MLERADQSSKDFPWMDGRTWIGAWLVATRAEPCTRLKLGRICFWAKQSSISRSYARVIGQAVRFVELRMFGQLDENPGKAEFSDSDGRIRTSVVGFGQDGWTGRLDSDCRKSDKAVKTGG